VALLFVRLYVSYDEELDKELATAADSIAALPSPMLMDKVLEILLESDAMPVRRLCVCLAPSLVLLCVDGRCV
jgi:hypothetical protein